MDGVYMVYYLLAADSVKALHCSWQVYLSVSNQARPTDEVLKGKTHFILKDSPLCFSR